MHSTSTTNRPRRRIGRILLAAAVAACALPASASAATLAIGNGTLVHQGGSERNSLSVRGVAGALIVSDTAGLSNIPLLQPSCDRIDRQTMRCPRQSGGRTIIGRFEARMGGGDDTAGPIDTQLPVVIDGGAGDDTYNAGNPSFLTQVTFHGGSGFGADTASYAGSGGSGGGRGVRITNDGQPNDGRVGLDTDNIGRDVIKLIGSPLADEITASVNSDLGAVFVTPGQGDDVMRAGSGPGNAVLFFNMGPVADGADKIIGGPVPSFVTYDDRTRPVTATLNFGGADDGEAGERDEILGGHESLEGGHGSDILRAPFGSRARHTINGNGGGDFIEGADGPDSLVGGPGLRDVIVAAGGDDQVFAKDGERDEVDCGLGTDTFDADSVDDLGSCENGTIGVLRLAPKTLRAEVGETAQLKLSWHHPRAWRQLRRIELRLYRGESRVGAVAIRPRNRRIGDRGGVTVLRRSSRITRKGKTVGARLALRLDRRLAGRRLRVEVAAVDVRGTRQLEPRAGSIRVAG
jgi:hypothetical protein